MNDQSPFRPIPMGPVLITAANWRAIAEARGYEQEWFPHLEAYVTNQKLQEDVAQYRKLFKLADDGETILRRGTGKPAKPLNNGRYLQVSGTIEGKSRNFLVHRIIFALVHGWLPEQVDHANRDKLSNSHKNLRPADRAQNAANRTGAGPRRSDPSLGESIYRGTTERPRVPGGKFYWVRKRPKGEKECWLGPFDTHEAAQAARDAEKKSRHGERYAARYFRKSQSPPRGTSRLSAERSSRPKHEGSRVKSDGKSKFSPARNGKRKPKTKE